MDRLFLDANVLFSAAYGPENRLLQFWKLKGATLLSSRYALEEARVNLEHQHQGSALEKLAIDIELFEATQREWHGAIELPEKDRPIILAAIEGHATHLLTGDVRHFGAYFGKRVDGIAIMLPGEYLRLRGQRS